MLRVAGRTSRSRTRTRRALCAALIQRGVIPDHRRPDVIRFGFSPLTTRFVDVWDGVETLRELLRVRDWVELAADEWLGVIWRRPLAPIVLVVRSEGERVSWPGAVDAVGTVNYDVAGP